MAEPDNTRVPFFESNILHIVRKKVRFLKVIKNNRKPPNLDTLGVTTLRFEISVKKGAALKRGIFGTKCVIFVKKRHCVKKVCKTV